MKRAWNWRGILGYGLLCVVPCGFLVFAQRTFTDMDRELEHAYTLIEQCVLDTIKTEEQLQEEVRLRRWSDSALAAVRADLTMTKESLNAQLEHHYLGRRSAESSVRALREETEKLRQSIAALKAAAIETASIGKPAKPKRKRAKLKRKPSAPKPAHRWWW